MVKCLVAFAVFGTLTAANSSPGEIPGTDYKYKNHAYRITLPPASAGDGPFPLVAFFHARLMSGYAVNGYHQLVVDVNNAGYTVVTSFDHADVSPRNVVDWITETIEGAVAQEINRTDYSKVGIMGHSMGGGAVVRGMADAPSSLNIHAGVALHPWLHEAPRPAPSKSTGPIMYATGSRDLLVPAFEVKGAFEKAPHPRLFANLKGAGHMEPLSSPVGKHRWNPYVAAFLDCHLKKDEDACNKAYVEMGRDPKLPLVEFKSDPTVSTPKRRTKSSWPRATPESVGLDSTALRQADQEMSRKARSRACLVVIKDGKLVYETYSNARYNNTAHDGFSMTKTLGALIMLRAQTQGKLDIDKDITSTYGVRSPKSYPVTSRHIMSQSLAGRHGPGEKFAYDAFGTRWINRLPEIVKAATGSPAADILEEMKDVLGLSDEFHWPLVNHAWNGESFGTCEDYARFGQLMLDKGQWAGKEYISADLMSQLVTPHKFGNYGYSNPCYGLLTWLNTDKSKHPGTCYHAYPNYVDRGDKTFLENAPFDISMALGLNGEVTMVMPSQNAVVVSMGTTLGPVEVVRPIYSAICKALGACTGDQILI